MARQEALSTDRSRCRLLAAQAQDIGNNIRGLFMRQPNVRHIGMWCLQEGAQACLRDCRIVGYDEERRSLGRLRMEATRHYLMTGAAPSFGKLPASPWITGQVLRCRWIRQQSQTQNAPAQIHDHSSSLDVHRSYHTLVVG
jgi:hypothetical protein